MSGAWQNVGRNNRKGSGTPQNRSNTASPAPSNTSQPPKQENKSQQHAPAPTANVWQQKATERQAAAAGSSGSGSNGSPRSQQVSTPTISEPHAPVNGFDTAATKAFLNRNAASMPAPYRSADSGASSTNTNPSNMANGTPFLKHLAKEISKTEAGG
ncbi:hypothetical protein AC579_8767 [Pseudocercospora musae]|uniref:Uncharacterized protein n=1 Tax=Pseudocercospora musae TaxID=113226 RepID=A0A139IWP6_9PEZI|nr:hypothetical protein AC579_8767 [Pseudocercospora musae]